MRRVPEVIDAWFDSGSMPYAQWHYPFEHQADFKAHFPADYICEGVDQTRGWFYSLLAIGVAAFDSTVYKHVIVNELVLDVQGQKMSKSRGNVVNPWSVIEAHGADAVRLYLLGQSQVWLPKRFDERQIPRSRAGSSTRCAPPTTSSAGTRRIGSHRRKQTRRLPRNGRRRIAGCSRVWTRWSRACANRGRRTTSRAVCE